MQAADRKLLASFIEHAVGNKVSVSEWARFSANHYSDSGMEQARVELVRAFHQAGAADALTENQKEKLLSIAKQLRE